MPEPTQETLAVWLQGVVATVPDAEAIKGFHAAVEAGAKVSGSQILDVVALGHNAANTTTIEWFANLARSKGAPIPSIGDNKALMTRLASASIVRLAASGGDPAIAAGLATKSAAFLGLIPDLPEVVTFADEAIATAGDAVRTWMFSYESTAPKIPHWVDQVTTQTTEGEPSERPQWEGPIIELAKQLDASSEDIRARLELLDEEYNLLWWSHAGRSITLEMPWSDVSPPERRVVLVGSELSERTHTPATAMVDGLAAVALGDVAAKEVALTDVVCAARDEKIALAPAEHALLPISTAKSQADLYIDDDDTWKKVVKKTHGIDVSMKRTAVAVARQLIREQQLGKLL